MNTYNASDKDYQYMQEALKLAELALQQGEVPVGAIIVYNGEIIGQGFNSPISKNDPTAHAEILALRAAGQKLQNYRLPDTTMYVTLEPCMMCFGAMLHARIKQVVFGAADPKTGALGGYINLSNSLWNHCIEYRGGILSSECGDLLKEFFKRRR